ncbi:MAG TPA: molybdopterin-dependent oxidoreductase, partial [Nitriliruptoraceae bacterium]|nr:molybdopterin-dependent oxidoreductase [Nitriliruptoraceae bacterium]
MKTRTHKRTCSLCEAMCGITVTLEDERITSIRGDHDDPFSRGHICPKALALQDVWEDPDRLRHPVVKRDGEWVEVDWEEALDVAAAGIRQVQAEHGRTAMGIYLGNPNAHNLGPLLFGSLLIKALRTTNRFSATSVDQLPHQFVQYHLYGHQLLFPIPDLDRTDLLVVFGANPMQSNGSLMSTGGFKDRLRDMRQRGGRMVVVDPRRTRTAELADQYLPIRPRHDVAILLALLQVIFEEDLVSPGRLGPVLDGMDALADLVAEWTPERVAERCGWTPTQVR